MRTCGHSLAKRLAAPIMVLLALWQVPPVQATSFASQWQTEQGSIKVRKFRTARLRSIAQTAAIKLPATLAANTNYKNLSWKNGTPAVQVRTNQWGEVCHIGYRIFAPELRKASPSPLYDFIERYLLELDLPSDLPRNVRLEVDGVVVEGDLRRARTFNGSEQFSVEQKAMNKYVVRWRDANGTLLLGMGFRMDSQLLAGSNSVEMEENLRRDLLRTVPLPCGLSHLPKGNITSGRNIAIEHRASFLSRLIRNDLYLLPGNGSTPHTLIADARLPMQSAANLMLTGKSITPVPAQIVLDRYGYASDTLHTTWSCWVNFCQQEGDEIFFGLKEQTATEVKGTLFAVNRKAAYCHMMSVSVPTALFAGAQFTICGRLYAYIPLHSVSQSSFNFFPIDTLPSE